MEDNLELFDSIYNNKCFESVSFILFANKKDIFKQKLSYTLLKNFYKQYNGKFYF